MKKLCCLLLLSSFLNANSQQLKFTWEDQPKPHTITQSEFLKESAINILEKQQLEFSLDKKGELNAIKRIHRIIRVNDEKGIESFNKIKIGYYEDKPIKRIQARTILASGKVIELKSQAFADSKEKDGQMIKLFAFEGIEKGAEVEYILEIPENPKLYGSYVLQDQIPTIKSEFELVTPSHLVFEIKGYNGAKAFKDTLIGEIRSIYGLGENMKALEEEKMAVYYPHFARVDYTFAYNVAQKGKDIRVYTWDEAAKNIYRNNTNFSEKGLKAVTRLLDDQKEFKKLNTNAEKQVWIEDFVKSNYVMDDDLNVEDDGNFSFIIKNKVGDKNMYRSFLAAMYVSQKIDFEIGYTTNRFQKKFDYSFQNWDNLKNCIFYFPDTKRFMAPTEQFYRIPFIPDNWGAQDAMFCKVLRLGDVVTASAEKRKLPEVPASVNSHNHIVDVTFHADMDTTLIDYKNTMTGYNASDIMPNLVYLDGDKREDFLKQILNMSDKEEKYTNIYCENNKFSSATNSIPLIMHATIHATNSTEKIGNKYLFKIGELIGRQAEMYQEKPRQFPVEILYPHHLERKLTIHIPDGYKVSNLEKLNMNVVQMQGDKEGARFTSSYKLENKILEVNIYETYNFTYTPIEYFEDYRKVVNAAADFNKLTVVFEKEK